MVEKMDQGTIAHQVGTIRQTVSRYLQIDQSPERRSPYRHAAVPAQ